METRRFLDGYLGKKTEDVGWAATEEDVKMKTAMAADTVRSIMERYIPDFDYLLR